jgi:hypothetical protein
MSIEETNDKYLCHIHRKPFTIYEEQNETIDSTHSSSTNSENQNMEIDETNEYNINNNNDIEYNTNIGDHNRNRSRDRGRGRENIINLPSPPTFNKFEHEHPLHDSSINLPDDTKTLSENFPYVLFSLFFTIDILNVIVRNTNIYASGKGAGIGRPWTDLNLPEIKIWLGIVIYAGIFKSPSIQDYWKKSDKYPQHEITNYMTLKRFEQIKRFFHISDPSEVVQQDLWYHKVEPLASYILNKCKEFYIPSSNLSVDEMIVRFSGRSPHTYRIKNKPTPEGYKILALCDNSGYTYSFMFTSRIKENPLEKVTSLSKIGCEVYHLIKSLPDNMAFNIYMDNYFSSINLFNFLRQKKIGACGTVRTSSSKFPKELKVEKKQLDWDILSGVVVDNVLSIFWMDNGPVTMLSTIHEITGPESRKVTKRKRPRYTSTNANKVREVFGDEVEKFLPIPTVIDDYNHFMGGVDVADQYRHYYNTQITARRTWVPIFFWLLDTAIVDSFLIYNKCNGKLSHKEFRLSLAWNLVTSGWSEGENNNDENIPSKSSFARINSDSTLPEVRNKPGQHLPRRGLRSACYLCRYIRIKEEGKATKSECRTQVWCKVCEVPLCFNEERDCYTEFHEL